METAKTLSMDKEIISFLAVQGELTIALSDDGRPYAASCFYAFQKETGYLIFKSELHTHHIQVGLKHAQVAGTVVEKNRLPGIIKGIQFTGMLSLARDMEKERAQSTYYGRYPFARAFSGELWIIRPDWIKMTDNTPLTGGKKIWKSTEHGI
ncbi:MAG: hypothetical protein IT233_01655 [Bacteroidia bacterium]|nr:hypothetical protein [Bacteroidia bacterium]